MDYDQKTIIISPSGNFYGSERVLWDYLKTTKIRYLVYVPSYGVFRNKLNELQHKVKGYNHKNPLYLYALLFLRLLFTSVNNLYINEGGHIRYVKLLANLFHKKNFYVHIRLVEDTSAIRLGKLLSNIKLVAISDYVNGLLPLEWAPNIVKMYDPFIFTNKFVPEIKPIATIGIIGRFSESKGASKIPQFFKFLDSKLTHNISVHLFGHIEQTEIAHDQIEQLKNLKHIRFFEQGFVENNETIYKSVDLVMHFSHTEPLGRIFLEAIEHQKAFIGFNEGGIGEIGEKTNLQKYLVKPRLNWENEMAAVFFEISTNWEKLGNELIQARKISMDIFSINKYVQQIDKLINNA